MRRSPIALIVALVAFTLGTSSAGAQDDGPKAGRWAAEAASGPAASLLRFRNASSAWILGVSAYFTRQTRKQVSLISGTTTTTTEDLFTSQVRLGLRRYGQARERVRTFSTLSGIIGYSNATFSEGWQFGASGELGAAYFFSPHVSLGASGELAATYRASDGDPARFIPRERSLLVAFNGFRLLGAVYF